MIDPRIIEGTKLMAIEFSKNWWEVKEKGKTRKYYFDVYFNPETAEIQIGEMDQNDKIPEGMKEIYSLWKSLSRKIVWNYGASALFNLCYKLIETQADIEEMKSQIKKEDFQKKLKPRTWIKFSGGSEQ